MNILDRAIAFVSPIAGVRRALAREGLNQVRASQFDGAMVGRRTSGWVATNASSNAITRGSLPLLRARSRDVMRNTWWGARIARVFVAHAIGAGIMPRSKDAKQAIALWKAWGKSCDAEGQLDINGLIALATTCIIESGEVLIRLVPRTRVPGQIPLELQLLEPDHLDPSHDRVGLSAADGAAMVNQGIAYGADGKRLGYWLFPEHPGERGLVIRLKSVFVPASEVLHIYRKDRIGQGRGVPWCAPVLLKGRDLADLEEAVVVKAKIEACLAAFIKTDNTARTLVAAKTATDGSNRRLERLSPGMITYLQSGEELQTVAPTASIQFESVLLTTWMTLAAGAGITYDQMTGDLRQANYSSLRAGKIEFRRIVEQFQYLTLVPMLLEPIWRAFTQTAMDAGELRSRGAGYQVDEWIMPANEPIDPLKDLQADLLAVRSGRMTWPQFVASWGYDPDDQMDEIAAWFKDMDAKGVVLDTDPRRKPATVSVAAKDDTPNASDATPDQAPADDAADPNAGDNAQ